MRASVVVLLLAAACSSRGGPDRGSPDDPGASPATAGARDAGEVTGTTPARPRDAAPGDPGGYHLDDPTVEYDVGRPAARRKGRPIELLLRSSPPGAVAAVDGDALGPTPALWSGEANGHPRDFTFVLPGYATARYRFVPVQDGVVHGTLERLKLDSPDAGP